MLLISTTNERPVLPSMFPSPSLCSDHQCPPSVITTQIIILESACPRQNLHHLSNKLPGSISASLSTFLHSPVFSFLRNLVLMSWQKIPVEQRPSTHLFHCTINLSSLTSWEHLCMWVSHFSKNMTITSWWKPEHTIFQSYEISTPKDLFNMSKWTFYYDQTIFLMKNY